MGGQWGQGVKERLLLVDLRRQFVINVLWYSFVLAPSAAPGDVQCHYTSSTSIQVSWVARSAADQNGALTVYTVYYQAVGGHFNDGTLKQQAVVAPLSQVVLTGLEEYVEYNISVSAWTSVGEGPLSASIIVRTAEAGKTVSVEKNCVLLKIKVLLEAERSG